jgi:hypothetical protein
MVGEREAASTTQKLSGVTKDSFSFSSLCFPLFTFILVLSSFLITRDYKQPLVISCFFIACHKGKKVISLSLGHGSPFDWASLVHIPSATMAKGMGLH